MTKRPNFILFITDQQRADYLGCTGHPVLKTPNIDAIAQAGTIWDKFYVASPVCMPNRASFMTCRMPSSHGGRSNGIPLDKRNVTFVDLLRDAGYKTALVGKSHLQTFSNKPPLTPKPATREGFHRASSALSEAVRHDHATYRAEAPDRTSQDMQLPFYGFDHVELVTRHGANCGGDYRDWLLEKAPDADELLNPRNQLEHDFQCPQAIRTALREEFYSTSYIAERAAAWIEENSEDDQPYFLMVSFPDPHHPFNPPGRYWDMYSPEEMQTPAAINSPDWTPPPYVSAILQQRKDGTANMQGMAAIATTEQEAREAQALTCGMISMVDDAVGRVRAASGAKAAVTIFTADHGEHLGDHRMLFKGAAPYEEITRVPFIWSDPSQAGAAHSDDIGQTHDIGVTILERAGIEAARGMQGRSLLEGGRETAFIQYEQQAVNPGLGFAPRVHTVRTSQWRLSIIDGHAEGELYDLDADPDEFTNLWADPAYAAQRASLIETLARQEIAHVAGAPFPTAQA